MKTIPTLFFILLCTTNTLACSCMQQKPVEVVFPHTDSIFLGEILSNEIDGNFRKVVCKRLGTAKGAMTDLVVVYTGRDSAACGVPFRIGKTYIIYAQRLRQLDRLFTGSCSRTRKFTAKNQSEWALLLQLAEKSE